MAVKKRKKYNPIKRFQVVSECALSKKAVVFVGQGGSNNSKCEMYDIGKRRVSSASEVMVKAISDVQHFWTVYIAVFCRRQDGQQYMASEQLTFPERRYQSELVDLLNDRHIALIKRQNGKHVANTGWIAMPRKDDLLESEAAEIFDSLGAWAFPARWEITENIDKEPA